MKTEDLRIEYQNKLPHLEMLCQEAEFSLATALSAANIKIHGVLGRVKKFDSFSAKVIRRQTENPFDDIGDLVGLRVVCLFRSDIPKVGEIIQEQFNLISEDNKIDGYEVSSFGYQSIHFIVSIKDEYTGPRYDSIKGTNFEIQLRTLAMDAWATISHYLDYKSDKVVPQDLRKDFYALSGLFYVADTHFEMFYKASESSKQDAQSRIEAEGISPDEPLNLDTFSAYVENKIEDSRRTDISPDNFSQLVGELISHGYDTVKNLDAQVQLGMDAFLVHEQKYPPGNEEGAKYNVVGLFRILLRIVDEKFLESQLENNLARDPERYREFRSLVEKS